MTGDNTPMPWCEACQSYHSTRPQDLAGLQCFKQTGLLLTRAADDIERHTKSLDRSTSICKDCHHITWSNRNEYQMAKELDAIVHKLRRFVADITKRGHR